MLVPDGMGVARYAASLRAAQLRLSDRAALVGAREGDGPGPPNSAAARARRALAVLPPWAARAEWRGDRLVAPDLFRTAQAFFTLHRRPLRLRAPGPAGVVHWAYPVPIHVRGWRNLYTVHDVIPLTDPALTPIDAGRHGRLLRALAARAGAIVAVSDAARDAIIGALGCAPDLVVNCSQPVDVGAETPAELLEPGLVPGRYLLMCGTVEPRKNVAAVVDAFRRSGADLTLVVAGPDGWRSDGLARVIAATPGAVRLGYRTRAQMLALIAHARALVMPSLAEGFGLPVAEAMALGTPVLTSRDGALAETAGGAALLVDPRDVDGIAAALARLAADDGLARALAAAGRVQAARFTAAAFEDRLRPLYARQAALLGDAGSCADTAPGASPPAGRHIGKSSG